MKKHLYIKPEMELLDSELTTILCVSGGNGVNQNVNSEDGGYDGEGGITTGGPGQEP